MTQSILIVNTKLSLFQLIAKLKAVFDRFDTNRNGLLSGSQLEQCLLYMNRPVDSSEVII